VQYADKVLEEKVPGAMMRRDYATVAQHHSLPVHKTPLRQAPVESGVGASETPGDQLMASVLQLLQGKTSISMQLAGNAMDPSLVAQLSSVQPGGRSPVVQSPAADLEALLSQLLGTDPHPTCEKQLDDETVCPAPPRPRNWRDAVQQHMASMVPPVDSSLAPHAGTTLSVPGLGSVRLVMMPAGDAASGNMRQLLQDAAGHTPGAPVRKYWGADTFNEKIAVSNAELLELEQEVLLMGRAAGFNPMAGHEDTAS